MKIILNKDIVGFGRKGEIKEVKEGYFRNFLMPRKLAEIATPRKIKNNEREVEEKEIARKKEKNEMDAVLSDISGKVFYLKRKINEKGSLYKAIGPKDVLEAINDAGYKKIPADWILSNPIKDSGKHEVEIKNLNGSPIKIYVEIGPEK